MSRGKKVAEKLCCASMTVGFIYPQDHGEIVCPNCGRRLRLRRPFYNEQIRLVQGYIPDHYLPQWK